MNALSPPEPKIVPRKCGRPPRGSPERREGRSVDYLLIYLPVRRGEQEGWVREMECPYLQDCGWWCRNRK